MLDQNTDRMWYVIGAVIIGAAIILILNGTMPQIFASVAETFEKKTEEVTTLTDGIGPVQRGDNLLEETDAGVGESFTTVSWEGWDYHLYDLSFNEYEVSPGDTFTFSFYVDETDVDVAAFLQARDETRVKFIQSINGNIIKAGESGMTSITWTVPDRTNSAVRLEDRTPADTVVLYGAIREVYNDNDYSYTSTAKYNDATIWKHE